MTTPDRDHNRAGVEAAMRGDLGAAEQAFRTALQSTPNHPGVFLNLTRLLQMQKRDRELIQLFETSFSKRDPAILPDPLKCMLAQSAFRISDYRLVIRLLKDLETSQLQRPDVSLPLSEAYLRAGQLTDAKTLLQQSLLANPNDPSLITNLAIVQMEQGDYDAAETLYQQVIQQHPQQFLGHYNLGRFYQTLGRIDEARQAFLVCQQLVPHAPEAKKALQELDASSQGSASASLNPLEACYAAIESQQWQLASERLQQHRNTIDHIRWTAAICELPSKWQAEFGDPASFSPTHLVQTSQLFDPHDGVLKTLVEEIRTLDSLVWNRAGKPTREGFQTHEMLAGAQTECVLALNNALTIALNGYLSKQLCFPIPLEPDPESISGWAVILKQGGCQKRHIHPEAKISGVLYLSVDEITASDDSPDGNLIFSTPSPLEITPKAGRVVFFPSFLPHETIPQSSASEDRICIAFNFS